MHNCIASFAADFLWGLVQVTYSLWLRLTICEMGIIIVAYLTGCFGIHYWLERALRFLDEWCYVYAVDYYYESQAENSASESIHTAWNL